MNDMPIIGFFLKYFNAVVLHINQGCFGKKLIGQHRHILAKLYARTAKVIVAGKKFSLNRIQKSTDAVIIFHPVRIRPIKIRKTLL